MSLSPALPHRFDLDVRPLGSVLRGRLATGASCFKAEPAEGGRWNLLGAALETRSLVLAHRVACERFVPALAEAHAELVALLDALIRVANSDSVRRAEGRRAALALAAAVEAAVVRHDEALAQATG